MCMRIVQALQARWVLWRRYRRALAAEERAACEYDISPRVQRQWAHARALGDGELRRGANRDLG
jgi:hypothetical protein